MLMACLIDRTDMLSTALSVKGDGSDSAVTRKYRPGVLESLAESRISGLNK